MNRLLQVAALTSWLLCAQLVQAGEWEDGYDAYKRRDYVTAVKLWRIVAERGDAAGQSIMGKMYAFGQGVPQSYPEALKWYRLAAAQGEARAQFSLGFMNLNGQGLPQNNAEAVKWFRLAAAQDNADAQHNLSQMYAKGLSVDQSAFRAYMWGFLAAASGHTLAKQGLKDLREPLTPKQIAQAKTVARECQLNAFKGCQ